MYTSYIGKKFLTLYNERENNDLSAEQFFDEVFFDIIFNDESHLLHVGNSPFFQKPKAADVEKFGSKPSAQLSNLKKAIRDDPPNMSIFVGYGSKDVESTTSGQVTTLDVDVDTEEMYASWIGQALAIGLSGGYVILIDENEVIWSLYKGWKVYRKYLAQTPNLKDKQIETWNGHWLNHMTGNDFDPDDPTYEFNFVTQNILGKLAIPTIEWTRVIFSLARKCPNVILTAYAYNLSQTNTTLGFVNLFLPGIKSFTQIKDVLKHPTGEISLTVNELELMKPFFNFKNACSNGTIGLKALEPDKLRAYMPKGSVTFAQGREYKFSDKQSYYDYQIFKTWIIAMLKKTELLELASKLAQVLHEKERIKDHLSSRGKTGGTNFSKKFLEIKSLPDAVTKLTALVEDVTQSKDILKETLVELIEMPRDQFPLFIALVGFEYSYQKKHE